MSSMSRNSVNDPYNRICIIYEYKNQVYEFLVEPYKTLGEIKVKLNKKIYKLPSNIHSFYKNRDLSMYENEQIGTLFPSKKKITIQLKESQNNCAKDSNAIKLFILDKEPKNLIERNLDEQFNINYISGTDSNINKNIKKSSELRKKLSNLLVPKINTSIANGNNINNNLSRNNNNKISSTNDTKSNNYNFYNDIKNNLYNNNNNNNNNRNMNYNNKQNIPNNNSLQLPLKSSNVLSLNMKKNNSKFELNKKLLKYSQTNNNKNDNFNTEIIQEDIEQSEQINDMERVEQLKTDLSPKINSSGKRKIKLKKLILKKDNSPVRNSTGKSSFASKNLDNNSPHKPKKNQRNKNKLNTRNTYNSVASSKDNELIAKSMINTPDFQCCQCSKNVIEWYCRKCNAFICKDCKEDISHDGHYKILINLDKNELNTNTIMYSTLLETDILKRIEKIFKFNDRKYIAEINKFQKKITELLEKLNNLYRHAMGFISKIDKIKGELEVNHFSDDSKRIINNIKNITQMSLKNFNNPKLFNNYKEKVIALKQIFYMINLEENNFERIYIKKEIGMYSLRFELYQNINNSFDKIEANLKTLLNQKNPFDLNDEQTIIYHKIVNEDLELKEKNKKEIMEQNELTAVINRDQSKGIKRTKTMNLSSFFKSGGNHFNLLNDDNSQPSNDLISVIKKDKHNNGYNNMEY